MKYDEIIEVNGNKLTKKYIEGLNKEEREALVDPTFEVIRKIGFMYPNESDDNLLKEYKRVQDCKSDLNVMEAYNNSSVGTSICKHFCSKEFFGSTEFGKKTILDVFNDDKLLKKTIFNRFGGDWLEKDNKGPGVNQAFNISMKMICFQGFRSQRLVPAISMFKADLAKLICQKYSNEGDTIFDYSAGFGGRLLGAISCNRKYIATDPLTVPSLEKMAEFFKFDKNNYKLIQSGSENYKGDEDSIDLCWSSPPYAAENSKQKLHVQEWYSNDSSQAYSQGYDYFFNTYWKGTLENIKYMLKPGKWFGLNTLSKNKKMIQMATDVFGEPLEIFKLRTVRSHLTKTDKTDATKFEPLYIFKNNK